MVLVLVLHLADGTEPAGYAPAGDNPQATAHKLLLASENEARDDHNRQEPDDMLPRLTAENAPLRSDQEGKVFWLGGEGDDGGEGFRVWLVAPATLAD